ncbi:MAG: type II toxin-antitoxin system RelE/ParE family toxin [Bdellovibrionales bacterium]|nr:type II toxin-antitoxin system RelE/ParE family toxin [Bdellovibrionales bacterium]
MARNKFDMLCPIGHNEKVRARTVEYFIAPTGRAPAREWLESLKDKVTQAILFRRIRQVGLGNFGKTRGVGKGVHELKIDYGPGYRIYFGVHRDELILLLTGGNKRTQQSDIEKAQTFWKKWLEDQGEN